MRVSWCGSFDGIAWASKDAMIVRGLSERHVRMPRTDVQYFGFYAFFSGFLGQKSEEAQPVVSALQAEIQTGITSFARLG
jgi:hypothetical protein